jgi:uncharacterized protein (TIGR02679 family)
VFRSDGSPPNAAVRLTPSTTGAQCQPLICVGGQPSAVGWRLLELLALGGAEFEYHGDFDWGGVRIARTVRDRVTWRSWRYDRQACEAAVASADSLTPFIRLTGEPSATPWDPGLAAAMPHRNVRVEEELTLDALLRDLVPWQAAGAPVAAQKGRVSSGNIG